MEFKSITNDNLWEVVNLKVKANQEEYIATNTISLLEAYATQNEGEQVKTFAIYEKGTLVGFFMINFNVFNWKSAPKVARNNYCLWRFMIDQRYQGKGLGKKALNEIIKYVKTMPLGKGNKLYLSYIPENDCAGELFKEVGFVPNGENNGEEIVIVLDLGEKR